MPQNLDEDLTHVFALLQTFLSRLQPLSHLSGHDASSFAGSFLKVHAAVVHCVESSTQVFGGVCEESHQMQALLTQVDESLYAEGVIHKIAVDLQLFKTGSQIFPEGQLHVLVASQIFPPVHFVSSGLHHHPASPEHVRTPHSPQLGGGVGS